MRVAAAAEGTLLAEISRLLENALQARSRYVQLADRASRLYAPVVHATALLTMLGWVLSGASWHDAIVTAIAVLIITCPCALGLAIPAVQTVVAGAMFRTGVLINSGDAIERVAEVDTVVFDKTGTLTLPELDVVNAAGIPTEIFELAGRLALSSHHPVAAAVARASEAKSPLPGVRRARAGRARVATASSSGLAVRPFAAPNSWRTRSSARIRKCPSSPSVRAKSAMSSPCGSDCAPMRRAPSPRCKARGIAIEILSGDREPAVRHAAETLGVTNGAPA